MNQAQFDPKILSFLQQLAVNNNREWFHDNKAKYEEAKALFLDFIQFQIQEIQLFDTNLKDLSPKECLFRIHRDIRFSKDKTPYKIHFGAYMAKGGRKSKMAAYYTHIEPDNSFLMGGIHRPESPVLKKIRDYIYEHTDEFKTIIEAPEFKATFPKIYGEKLKTAPKGFPKDFPFLELIQYKWYDFLHPISDEELLHSAFPKQSIDVFLQADKVNRFFNKIIF